MSVWSVAVTATLATVSRDGAALLQTVFAHVGVEAPNGAAAKRAAEKLVTGGSRKPLSVRHMNGRDVVWQFGDCGHKVCPPGQYGESGIYDVQGEVATCA